MTDSVILIANAFVKQQIYIAFNVLVICVTEVDSAQILLDGIKQFFSEI